MEKLAFPKNKIILRILYSCFMYVCELGEIEQRMFGEKDMGGTGEKKGNGEVIELCFN